MIDVNLYRGRRQRLAEQMGRGVAVLSTAPERVRNRDAHYPYRFDSYFHYLTAFAEPEAVLVVIAGDAVKSLLFCRDKHEEREIWDGFRYGPQAAREAFGFDEAHSITTLDEMLPTLLADQPAMFCDVGENSEWDTRLIKWLNAVRAQVRTGIAAPSEIRDVRKLLDEMRLTKDAHELDIMRRAARISANAHRRAMRHTRPGLNEYQIEAELLHEFRSHGAQAPAYTADRGGRRQRVRPALRVERRSAARRRPAADRRRLRAGRVRLGHHPHFPRQRPLQPRAARRVCAGVGRPGGRHRQGRRRATPGRIRTTPPCACLCRASSTLGCSRAASMD